jgi:hypothetical protein
MRLSAMPSVQNPGRNGTGIPSEPAVKPRQRLAPSSSTCETAIVAMTKYGPRSRFARKPMTVPAALAKAAPIATPNHGEMFQRTAQSAAA